MHPATIQGPRSSALSHAVSPSYVPISISLRLIPSLHTLIETGIPAAFRPSAYTKLLRAFLVLVTSIRGRRIAGFGCTTFER